MIALFGEFIDDEMVPEVSIHSEDETDDDDIDLNDEYFVEASDDVSEFVRMVNFCHRTWDDWNPECIQEQIMKKAINSQIENII